MVNVVFSYRSDKPRAKIEIRFVYFIDGVQKSIRSRINKEVSKTFWSEYREKKEFRDEKKVEFRDELDDELKKIKDFVLKAYNPAIKPTREWLNNTLIAYENPNQSKKPDSLIDFFDEYLEDKAGILKESTIKKLRSVRNKIERFQIDTKSFYRIKDVNQDFWIKWKDWSLKEKYDPDTINTNFKNIKTVCKEARKFNIETYKNLGSLNDKLKTKKSAIIYLSFDELKKIKKLKDLPEHLDNVRDWLIISCYTGQRISDFMRFNSKMIRTTNSRKFIDITQQKTQKEVSIPLLPIVEKILKKRNGEFPRPISDQRYNDYIKDVCELAEITEPIKGKIIESDKGVIRKKTGVYKKCKLITSHTGRRSFASNYYDVLPTSFLKDITGHSSESMLLKYIGKTTRVTAKNAFDIMLNHKS
ncbi:MAG: tyrosine-type recombinase/integrase [Moheibacter sp.]